ncbi:MAG: hypothetical protein PHU85_09015 [Phycisphaerae bacterium]|nr:hypothetical protein [Phycisphaerae bacterium]
MSERRQITITLSTGFWIRAALLVLLVAIVIGVIAMAWVADGFRLAVLVGLGTIGLATWVVLLGLVANGAPLQPRTRNWLIAVGWFPILIAAAWWIRFRFKL